MSDCATHPSTDTLQPKREGRAIASARASTPASSNAASRNATGRATGRNTCRATAHASSSPKAVTTRGALSAAADGPFPFHICQLVHNHEAVVPPTRQKIRLATAATATATATATAATVRAIAGGKCEGFDTAVFARRHPRE